MTRCSESRQEAVMPTPLLIPMAITDIATWNSTGCTGNGELQDIAARTMRDAVEAVRPATTLSGQTDIIFGSRGRMRTTHKEGVAIMLSKEAQRALISLEAVLPRIVTASVHRKKEEYHDYGYTVLFPCK